MAMEPITRIPTERPTYRELKAKNTWLQDSLEEARKGQDNAERLSMMCLVLLAITSTLLALTWSGIIVV